MTMGESVRAARKKAGLSQKELAERVGINKSRISDIERDKGFTITETYIQIARVLKVSIDELLGPLQPPSARRDNRIFIRPSKREVKGEFAILKVNGFHYLLPKGYELTVPVEVAEAYNKLSDKKRKEISWK